MNDLISRQAVIDACEQSINILEAVDRIMDLPSVNPQPKTGHWIAEENEEMETIGYYCSECDLPMETENQTRFCPNCGAKMEVSE